MLPYAILGIFIAFLLFAYVIIQGTRATLAWRTAAEKGDTKVIRDIVTDALKVWGAQKRPKPVSAEVWRGIQSISLTAVGPDYVRVSCVAESDYKMADGRWVEIRNPLQEGIAITVRAAEMLFYELPHFRPESIQIDLYTDYRDDSGRARRECIMTTRAARQQAREIDWDEWTPDEITQALGAVYSLSENGRPLPVPPLPPPDSAQTPEEIEAAASAGPEPAAGAHS